MTAPIRGVIDRIDDIGEQGHVDPRDPHLTKTQEEIDNTPLPTHDEWAQASTQMAAQTQVGWFGRLRSRIRHAWETWKGERRHQLRAWLGIAEEEEKNYLNGVTTFRWWTDVTNGIRADLDATNAAMAKENAALLERLALTEANLAEVVRQFHVQSQAVDSHAVILRAWKGIPLLQRASQAALKAQQQVAKEREARRAQEATAPTRPNAEHVATLPEDTKVIAFGDRLVAAHPDEPPEVFPTAHIDPPEFRRLRLRQAARDLAGKVLTGEVVLQYPNDEVMIFEGKPLGDEEREFVTNEARAYCEELRAEAAAAPTAPIAQLHQRPVSVDPDDHPQAD